ncbi:uncharacterized protein LOC144344657 [Saccoglossus kowalevskii]
MGHVSSDSPLRPVKKKKTKKRKTVNMTGEGITRPVTVFASSLRTSQDYIQICSAIVFRHYVNIMTGDGLRSDVHTSVSTAIRRVITLARFRMPTGTIHQSPKYTNECSKYV